MGGWFVVSFVCLFVGWLVCWLVVSCSVGQSVTRSVGRSIAQPLGRSLARSLARSGASTPRFKGDPGMHGTLFANLPQCELNSECFKSGYTERFGDVEA